MPPRSRGNLICAVGRSRLITDHSEIRELDQLSFTPWSQHPDRNYIALDIDLLRGKRLAPTA